MINLYGKLRDEFGDSIDCKVHSIPELLKAAEANRPGFKNYIQKDHSYVIMRGADFKTAQDVEEAEIEMIFADTDWHVMPAPEGQSGAVKMLAGAVLIAVAYVNPFGWMTGPVVTGMYAAGAGLVIGGISSYLVPAPKAAGMDSADDRPSYIYDGPTNRIAPGGAVTLIYGNCFVGSTVISLGLETGDLV